MWLEAFQRVKVRVENINVGGTAYVKRYFVGFDTVLGKRSRLFDGILTLRSLDKMGSERRRFLLEVKLATAEGVSTVSIKTSFLAVRNAAIGSGLTRSVLGWCLGKPSVSSAIDRRHELKNS